MRRSRILDKLSRDEPSWGIGLHFIDPSVWELASLIGVDGIWMDLEHHGTSVETATTLMRAARVGDADIVARPAKGELMRMGRLLEMGATGIMYPRCDSPEEAAEVVRWAKFAPQGTRGFDGGNPDMPYLSGTIDGYIREANERTFVITQLETQSAVDQAEAIAAVEGVQFLMLGPGDFSILSGFPGQFDNPKVQAAIDTIAAAARNTGKSWAAPCGSLELARQYVDAGCRLAFHCGDLVTIKSALEETRKAFEAMGFRFPPSRLAESPFGRQDNES